MYEVYHVSQCGKHSKRGHALYLLVICFFSHKKISLHSLREKIRIRIGTPCVHIFSHPDFTVGAGISPARLLRVRGLYHRYGISPFPKDKLCYSILRTPQKYFCGVLYMLNNYSNSNNYARILATTPDPTVLPPSRIAKRRPSSQAIGVISSTVISTLSPGRHISTSAGSSITPVTSVVLK